MFRRLSLSVGILFSSILLQIPIAHSIEGDINFDGIVNAEDLVLLQENWHQGLGSGSFSGSKSCSTCHEEIYGKWKSSLHALLYRDPSDPRASVLPSWGGDVTVSGGGLSLTATLQKRGASEYWMVLHFADGDREYRVDRIHGGFPIDENEDPRSPEKPGHSKWIGKQRYQTKIGEGFYILPFQWNPTSDLDGQGKGWGLTTGDEETLNPDDEKAVWVPYNLAHWVNAAGNYALNLVTRSEERNCAGCHQAGVKPVFDEVHQQYEHNASEPNITCENCHGPGGKHIVSQDPADITNPGKLADTIRQNESCGQCHSRGESIELINGLALEYPYAEGKTYRPGDVLEELYHYDLAANQWPDGTAKRHHQQHEDYTKSAHFTAGVRCWDCHDPHGSDSEHDLTFTARDNTLCLRCHEASYASSGHTHHEAPSNNNSFPRCVDCHMPAVQPSGVNYDIHAHTFKVMLPQGTLDYQGVGSGQPNACALCHRSEGGATDTNIGVWNQPSDITIATYLDGFADSWWGDYPTPTPTPDPVEPTPTPTQVPAFLGSTVCVGCHTGISPEIVNKWQSSLHSSIYRDPASAAAEFLIPEASWTGTVKVSGTVSGSVYTVTATLEIRNSHERWFVMHFGDGDREYRVDRVHGGKSIPSNADPRNPNRAGGTAYIGKQRYQTKIGDAYYILPFQYNPTPDLDEKRKGWVAYNPNNWTTPQGNYALNLTTQSEDRKCAGCHQQGVEPSLAYNSVAGATQYIANEVAPNIGCENCHGPGGNHIANLGNPSGKRGIVIPSMFDVADRRLETCGQCHSRGLSVGKLGGRDLEYPFNGERIFLPGDILADFYTDGGGDWPDGISRQHHQQYLDYLYSKHWAVAKLDCWACHDPHGSDFEHDLKASARDNGLCLQCHPGMDAQSHTHHGPVANGNSNPRCTDCHMPAVQNSGVNYDIHAHTFEPLLPEKTLFYQKTANGQPNACSLCHRSFGGFQDTNAGVWNDPADISIATLLDEKVKEWWPGPLAKEKGPIGSVRVILEEDLDQ